MKFLSEQGLIRAWRVSSAQNWAGGSYDASTSELLRGSGQKEGQHLSLELILYRLLSQSGGTVWQWFHTATRAGWTVCGLVGWLRNINEVQCLILTQKWMKTASNQNAAWHKCLSWLPALLTLLRTRRCLVAMTSVVITTFFPVI